MTVYIAIVVSVLLTLELAGLLGLRNDKLRRETAKNIARELHELSRDDKEPGA